ncbi:MAG: pyruvate dehydrogenase complex dihydrolipoamide acetyltransferase [Gemmatimonadetes bacterium]|nr:pyruvate dehydrogenase complex dihydrolipoamide acetyltransferase [Gemmatimonadota bacterium]
MATKVFMEALSPTMEEGRLVKWTKNEGDAVKSGDPIAEVETDKAIMELVARGDGVLRKRLVAEGESKPVGTLIGVIAPADENIDALIAGAGAPAAGGDAKPAEQSPAKPQAAAAAPAAPAAAQPTPAAQPAQGAQPAPVAEATDGQVRSSPLARRLASDRGLDLSQVRGSGPGGRIIKRDVESAVATPSAAGGAARPTSNAPRAGDFEDISLTQIRKTIAKRLAESIGPIPTFYLTAEFDLSRVTEMRAAMVEMGDEFKVSINDILMKAVATALAQHPEVNAHWLGDRIRQHHRVHLGMAVATPDGLIVPVIFDADQKRMSEISREARELAKKARERKLKPDEYTGSTFSISNLGMMGISQFTAIINPPEVAILAIGASEDVLVPDGDDGVEVRKRIRVTMSCDHRAVDGAVGAAFLQTLRRLIENPLMLVF